MPDAPRYGLSGQKKTAAKSAAAIMLFIRSEQRTVLFFSFEYVRRFRQQIAYLQMLRTYRFALSALYAIACPAAPVPGMDLSVIKIGIPIPVLFLRVHIGKQICDQNAFRATVYAISASRTLNKVFGTQYSVYLFYRPFFVRIQQYEFAHATDVVAHLFKAAHPGQSHEHAFLPRREPQGVSGVSAAVQRAQDVVRFLRQSDKAAAFYRLHHYYGFSVATADLQALPRLYAGIVEVDVIQLYLHRFDFGVFGKDRIREFGAVVEGQTDVFYLSLRFQFLRRGAGEMF